MNEGSFQELQIHLIVQTSLPKIFTSFQNWDLGKAVESYFAEPLIEAPVGKHWNHCVSVTVFYVEEKNFIFSLSSFDHR